VISALMRANTLLFAMIFLKSPSKRYLKIPWSFGASVLAPSNCTRIMPPSGSLTLTIAAIRRSMEADSLSVLSWFKRKSALRIACSVSSPIRPHAFARRQLYIRLSFKVSGVISTTSTSSPGLTSVPHPLRRPGSPELRCSMVRNAFPRNNYDITYPMLS